MVRESKTMNALTTEEIWNALDDVKDPEIPVVSVIEMGIVREVNLSQDGTRAVVTMTPTFVGCPALTTMRDDIAARIEELGVSEVEVKTSLNPPWTSRWIAKSAYAKLKSIGLAPPPQHEGEIDAALLEDATCPNCESADTALDSLFGPTACRALYYCNNCKQSFEQFKPI